MTLKSLIEKFADELQDIYDEQEIKALTRNTLAHVFNFSSTDISLKKKEELNESSVRSAIRVLTRLKKYEPIQYIIGETEFYGLRLKVDKNVLIPRPETEELIAWIIEETSSRKIESKSFSMLDIGTGSGCIAIALKKKFPMHNICGIDISETALEVAKTNARMNKATVKFLERDILQNQFSAFKKGFDVIVSNPPYVTLHEKQHMHRNVTDYEPHIALFVQGKNPFLFYERIADVCKGNLLNAGGYLYFETNEAYAAETGELLVEKGFKNLIIKRDMSSKERMIRVIK
jgi:release factor glutamine methyltransferase